MYITPGRKLRLKDFTFNSDPNKWNQTLATLNAISPNQRTPEHLADLIKVLEYLDPQYTQSLPIFLERRVQNSTEFDEVKVHVCELTTKVYDAMKQAGITTSLAKVISTASYFDTPVALGIRKQFELQSVDDTLNIKPANIDLTTMLEPNLNGITLLTQAADANADVNIIPATGNGEEDDNDQEIGAASSSRAHTPTRGQVVNFDLTGQSLAADIVSRRGLALTMSPTSTTLNRFIRVQEHIRFPWTRTQASKLVIERVYRPAFCQPPTNFADPSMPYKTPPVHSPVKRNQLTEPCHEAIAVGFVRYFVSDACNQTQWSEKIYSDCQLHPRFALEGVFPPQIANRIRHMEKMNPNGSCPSILEAAFAINSYWNHQTGSDFPDTVNVGEDLNSAAAFTKYAGATSQESYENRWLNCPTYASFATYSNAHIIINFNKSFQDFRNRTNRNLATPALESIAFKESQNIIVAICTDMHFVTYVLANRTVNRIPGDNKILTAATDGPAVLAQFPPTAHLADLVGAHNSFPKDASSTQLIYPEVILEAENEEEQGAKRQRMNEDFSQTHGRAIMEFRDASRVVLLITNTQPHNTALRTHQVLETHPFQDNLEFISVPVSKYNPEAQVNKSLVLTRAELHTDSNDNPPESAIYKRLFF